jgi:hypothetical protein
MQNPPKKINFLDGKKNCYEKENTTSLIEATFQIYIKNVI